MSALWLFLLGTILVTGGFVAVTEFGGGGAPMQRAPDFSFVLDEVAEIAERIDEQVSGRTGEAARDLGDFLGDLPQQLGVESDEDESAPAEDPSLPTDEAASTDVPDPVSESPGPPPSMFGFDLVDAAVDDSTSEDPEEGPSDPALTEDDSGGEQNSGRRVDVCQSGGTNTVTVDQHGGAALVNQGGEEGVCES
jgi:hypothetical protein